jgi:hypothetical protein
LQFKHPVFNAQRSQIPRSRFCVRDDNRQAFGSIQLEKRRDVFWIRNGELSLNLTLIVQAEYAAIADVPIASRAHCDADGNLSPGLRMIPMKLFTGFVEYQENGSATRIMSDNELPS